MGPLCIVEFPGVQNILMMPESAALSLALSITGDVIAKKDVTACPHAERGWGGDGNSLGGARLQRVPV